MHKKNIIISFIAGFLIGICSTILTVNILNLHQQGIPGRSPETVIPLKKTEQPSPVSQQTRSSVDNLTLPKAAATGEENYPHPPPAGDNMLPTSVKKDDKALVPPQEKDAAIPKANDEFALGRIKVHIQYVLKDKKIAEAFSADLSTKGYASVDIENIKHRHRDIRYFHTEDEKAALLLQKQFNNFIAGSTYTKKVNLKIRYLGKVYPNAEKGSIEVWVFF